MVLSLLKRYLWSFKPEVVLNVIVANQKRIYEQTTVSPSSVDWMPLMNSDQTSNHKVNNNKSKAPFSALVSNVLRKSKTA